MIAKCVKFISLVAAIVLLAIPAGAASTMPPVPDSILPSTYPVDYHPPISTPISGMNVRSSAGAFEETGERVEAQTGAPGKPGAVFAYSHTFGESEVAYFEDFFHTYNPTGLAFAQTGELYMVEETGARLIKYGTYDDWSASQNPVWRMGKAGLHDWGTTGLNYPHDVAVAPDGTSVWAADNDIISQFDAVTGKLLQRVPFEPWNIPDDNYRFGDARGIAFDTLGNMYVSDIKRQRVVVFTMDTGSPVYATTIEGFNSPGQIVIDLSDDSLYVTDVFNYVIQQCTPDKTDGWPYPYTCEVFFGVPGEQGKGDDLRLGMAFGLGFNPVHRILYIADGGSGTVRRCTTGPGHSCSTIVTGLAWPSDVEVDPSDSTLTVSDFNRNAIYRFYGEDHIPPGAATGDPLAAWLSNAPENEPYLTDDVHFNGPSGVEVDSLGNLYLVEEQGQRLTKMDKNGVVVWKKGTPGIANGKDSDLLDWPRAAAVDRRNILVVGGGGNLVRTYNAESGDYMDTLDPNEGGLELGDVWGVATDSANNIYVSDQKFNRITVYSYNPKSTTQKFKLIRQVGLGGDCGNRNDKFCNPRGLFVDANKNLYVADHDNCRVQVFDSKGNYKKTFGSGMCRDTFSSLGGPADVAVDGQGRVYVTEEWNSRVGVFDKSGGYLTTIGGSWGADSGALRNARGLAVDKQGFIYVADFANARVQKYAPNVPYWTQANINGFGNRWAKTVTALGTFKGVLYAGGMNEYKQAAIWKRVGTTWTPVMTDGFEDGSNLVIDHLLEYKGFLYATTANCLNQDCSDSNGGQMWRSADGLNWKVVVTDGFQNRNNAELFRMAVLGGKLCVSTWNNGKDGGELWCSSSGEIGTWQREVENGFGLGGNKVILSMVDYKSTSGESASYASTLNVYGYAHVWRKTAGGTSWQPLWNAWPDDGHYWGATGLTVYKGYLYVVVNTQHVEGLPDVGATIYRCQICDGTDWSKALPDAIEDVENFPRYGGLEATPYGLYAFFGNLEKGLDILYSKDGINWSRPFLPGLGSSNNSLTYWDNANLWSGKNLYLGISNNINGAGIWKLCPIAKACK